MPHARLLAPLLLAAPLGFGQEPAPPVEAASPATSQDGAAQDQAAWSRAEQRTDAVQAGLAWLAAAQDESGKWLSAGQRDLRDIGVTGLSLLAFQSAGHSMDQGPHKRTVRAAVNWLLEQGNPQTGSIQSELSHTGVYDHAIATLALLQTDLSDPETRAAVGRAVDFILRIRNPYGAWRYDVPPIGENDTSVSAWMALALSAAKAKGYPVDGQAFDGARSWFEEMTDPATGRVGYSEQGSTSARIVGVNDMFPTDNGEAMTAAALFTRLAMGDDPAEFPQLAKHAKLLLKSRPEAGMSALQSDMYYWFFGSRAMGRMGEFFADRWNESRDAVLLPRQKRSGPHAGSWDPDGPWGVLAGRAYSTSVAILALTDGPVVAQPTENAAAEAPQAEERQLPSDTVQAPVAPLWSNRRQPLKDQLRTEFGGMASKASLAASLSWLASHQAEDGHWEAGQPSHTLGITGLALLALMGDGNSTTKGPYKRAVADGIRFLAGQQDEETGLIGEPVGHTFLYSHGIATLALVEAWQDSGDEGQGKTAEAAVRYIEKARNPYRAWRYDVPPLGENDTSISAWMTLALVRARDAGMPIDLDALSSMEQWIQEVTDPETGRVGYDSPGSQSSRVSGVNEHYPAGLHEAMTGAGLFINSLLDPANQNESPRAKQQRLLLDSLPAWGDQGMQADWIAWFWGSYALRQVEGEPWKQWHAAMEQVLIENQVSSGPDAGSWPEVGPWTYAGGRAYVTAFGALCLQAPFRVEPTVKR